MYVLGLAAALIAVWIGLSGVFKPLLLGLGAASILVVLALSIRFRLTDRVGVPYFRLHNFLLYWGWLLVEIAKANWQVIRACLKTDLDISPALVKVKSQCKSEMAKTLFANSITLTPGTVTVEVDGDRLLVHALDEDNAHPEAFREMDRRSAKTAAEPAP